MENELLMDDLSEKLIGLGIGIFALGIFSFFLRPTHFDCNHTTNRCYIYKNPGIKQVLIYSDIEDCGCSSYTTSYTPSEELTKRRMLRDVGVWNYQTQRKTTNHSRFSLFIEDSKIQKYKNVDLTGIEADSCQTINSVCEQIKKHQTFKYKSQEYVHDFFEHWLAMIILGIILFIYGKKS